MSAAAAMPPVTEIVAAGLKAAQGGFELGDKLPVALREIQRQIGPGLLHAAVVAEETGTLVTQAEIGLTQEVAMTMKRAKLSYFEAGDSAVQVRVVVDSSCPHPDGDQLAIGLAEALLPIITEHYGEPLEKLRFMLGQANDRVSRMATACAHFFSRFKKYTWVGFYMIGDDPKVLKVGPYAGFPTCTAEIPIEDGMCGKSYSEKAIVNVADTSKAAGYIACHSSTTSELVLPVMVDGNPIGVLDLDSDIVAAFNAEDERMLSAALDLIFQDS